MCAWDGDDDDDDAAALGLRVQAADLKLWKNIVKLRANAAPGLRVLAAE